MTIQPNTPLDSSPLLDNESTLAQRRGPGEASDNDISSALSWIASSLSDSDESSAALDGASADQLLQSLGAGILANPQSAVQAHGGLDAQKVADLLQTQS